MGGIVRAAVILQVNGGLGREMVRGFGAAASENGWAVRLVAGEPAFVGGMLISWDPHICVLGVPTSVVPLSIFGGRPVVGLNFHRSCEDCPCVALDDVAAGREAAKYLASKGVLTFAPFSVNHGILFSQERVEGFRAGAKEVGGRFIEDGLFTPGPNTYTRPRGQAWIRSLPKGTGIMAACDHWANSLLLECRVAGVRVPEDLLVVGVDNDEVIAEIAQPSLSTVVMPWRRMGLEAAHLAEALLKGKQPPNRAVIVPPGAVIERNSTAVTAVQDQDVAPVLAFIHAHADRPLGVDDVLRHVPANRRRVERAFRRVLGRTVMQEVRRVRIEKAKGLLATTELSVARIAEKCGFGDHTRLGIAFRKEAGMTPTEYRRRLRGELEP